MRQFFKFKPNVKAWLAGAAASISVLVASFVWSGLGLGEFLSGFTTEQAVGQAVAWGIAQLLVWRVPNQPKPVEPVGPRPLR